MTDAVAVVDNQHRITFWNHAAERLYGVSADEVLGRAIEEVVRYRWLKAQDEKIAYDSLATTGAWRGKHIHTKKSGEEICVESSVSVLRDARGVAQGFLAVVRHVAERKRVEESLEVDGELYRTIFENYPIGIYRTTPDGRILMANAALLRMLGYGCFNELAARNLERGPYEPHYNRGQFKERLEARYSVWNRPSRSGTGR